MGVPQAEMDPVVVREHLYRELQKQYLVIPPDDEKNVFRPITEAGLGLFHYPFARDQEVSSVLPSAFSYGAHLFLWYLITFGTIAVALYFVYRVAVPKKQRVVSGSYEIMSLKDLEAGHNTLRNSTLPPLTVSSTLLSSPESDSTTSPELSPRNFYIKTTNIPDDVQEYKLNGNDNNDYRFSGYTSNGSVRIR